ncbi:MAG: HAMP domain-containing histidine kinase [Fibrobacteria bacterium]|nr:HAMP domain-containing histidine kinase [Fibrobacteria bacterium]
MTLVIFAVFFIINWVFIHVLQKQYREVTDKEARLYSIAISEQLHTSELNWVFAEILRKTKFPIIITDKLNQPVNWKNIYRGVIKFEKNRIPETIGYHHLTKRNQDWFKQLIVRLDKKNKPLQLTNKGVIFGYFHYGDISIINVLAWMPFLEFAFLLLFLLFGYYGYQVLRSGERHILWVALAKETAHQMGTPLSSLMGWMELLKSRIMKFPDHEKPMEILNEMDGDISRLTQVSIRFSHIGSLPKLDKQSLNTLVKSTADYFSNRLPQYGKKIELKTDLQKLPDIWINKELLGWVLENLIKNALDSIPHKHGLIKIDTNFKKAENTVYMHVEDNGKGVEKEKWKKIFQTGYSTKKRGWGLGLSLARRIVTIYHSGRIGIVWSEPGKGTKIRIKLPVQPERVKEE